MHFRQCGLSEEDIQIFNIRFKVTAQKGFYGKNYSLRKVKGERLWYTNT